MARYGDAWSQYPLSRGDVARCTFAAGSITLYCEDLRDVGPIQADVGYTDPPWTRAIASSFARDAHVEDMDLESIYEALDRILPTRCWVEQSLHERWWPRSGIETRTRYGARDAVIIANSVPSPPPGLGGATLVRACLSQVTGTILDPCAGVGLTLRIAHELGLESVGIEFLPRKAANLLAWAAAQGAEVAIERPR